MNKREEWDIPTLPVVFKRVDRYETRRSSPQPAQPLTDWFAIKKGTTQNYSEAIKTGHLKTKLTNEWKRMNAMGT
jgi:hypothetical protein